MYPVLLTYLTYHDVNVVDRTDEDTITLSDSVVLGSFALRCDVVNSVGSQSLLVFSIGEWFVASTTPLFLVFDWRRPGIVHGIACGSGRVWPPACTTSGCSCMI